MTKRKCWRPLDDTVLTFVSAVVVLSLHSKPTAISGTNNNNQLPSLAFKTIRKGCFITYQLVTESLTTTQGSILATVNWTYVDASDRRTIIHIRQGRSNIITSCVVLTTLTGYPLYVKSAVHELFSCSSSVKFGERFAESLSTTQSPVQQSAIITEKNYRSAWTKATKNKQA